MRIKIASIFVDDQDKALRFYTEKLGFIKKNDIPAGDFRWLTIVSADAPEGMELLLEPNAHKAAAAYQKAIFLDSIPATVLFVDDIQKEYERLKQLGIEFTTEPTKTGPVTIAVFNDTCGNLIQLVEQ
jgi:catechol 2,3-dioxygenase-like lactoylglutathione lyase family enzyme